jgi:hypothetical protein
VHPNSLDAQFLAFAHSGFRDLRLGADHDPVHTARDRPQFVVTTIALDLVGVRVDAEDLVTPLPQSLVDDVRAVAVGIPRNSRYGNALLRQKI